MASEREDIDLKGVDRMRREIGDDIWLDLHSTAWGIRMAICEPSRSKTHANVPLVLLRQWLKTVEEAREQREGRQQYTTPLALETMREGLSPLPDAARPTPDLGDNDRELVRQLRNLVIMDEVCSDNPLARNAASRITELLAEIERLKGSGAAATLKSRASICVSRS
jgi:hypothetical protein